VKQLAALEPASAVAGKSLNLSRQSVTPAPAFSQGPELGLVTSRAASPGEALASVPESLWITAAVAAKSELGAALAQLQEPWLQVRTAKRSRLIAEVCAASHIVDARQKSRPAQNQTIEQSLRFAPGVQP